MLLGNFPIDSRFCSRGLLAALSELDRERATLEKQEKTVIADIKKNAKAGQTVWPLCNGLLYCLGPTLLLLPRFGG